MAAISIPMVTPERDARRRSRSALHAEVVATLRGMILKGQLKPGERLPEAHFGAVLGVSRTPLREALKILAAEGLVELRPNRGCVIAPICTAEIDAIFETMGALEELAGALVCARISNVEISVLDELHERLWTAFRERDRTTYFEVNQRIHVDLVAAAKNPVLLSTYVSFSGKIERARFQANYDQLRWAASMAEHDAFMKALRRRNPQQLSCLLREHSDRTGQAVIQHLRSDEARTGAART